MLYVHREYWDAWLIQVQSAFWVVQVVFFEQLRVFLALDPTEVPGLLTQASSTWPTDTGLVDVAY